MGRINEPWRVHALLFPGILRALTSRLRLFVNSRNPQHIGEASMHRYVKHLTVLVIAVAVIFVVARYQIVQQSAEIAGQEGP